MISSITTRIFGEQDIRLTDLGKVNALCGKNGSGKSTILSAITYSSYARFSYGLELFHFDYKSEGYLEYQFTKDEILNIDQYISSNAISHVDRVKRRLEFQTLNKIRDAFLVNNNRIDVFESKDFLNNFIDKYIEVNRINYRSDLKYESKHILGVDKLYVLNLIDRTLEKVKVNHPKFLLSAKRNPSISTQIGVTDDVIDVIHRDDKLIEALFLAKNSKKGSSPSEKFLVVQQEFKIISQLFEFDITLENGKGTLVFTNYLNEWIIAEDSGLGLRDLLTIISNCVFGNQDIILIEEPENHLHPEVQRNLLEFLKFRCAPQIILTTHSSIFLDTSYIDSIHVCRLGSNGIEIQNEDKKLRALQELGYIATDNIIAERLLLVEGITDIPVLEEFLIKFDRNYNEYLKILSLGSVSNIAAADFNIVANGYEEVFVVVDGDDNRNSKKAIKTIKDKIEDYSNLTLIDLQGYGIENYLSSNAIRSKSRSISTDLEKFITKEFPPINKKIQGINKNANFFRNIAKEMTTDEVVRSGDIYEKLIKRVTK